ncbi:MAG: hypothetical protein ACPG19_02390 [Saprospiraceae bacterium]
MKYTFISILVITLVISLNGCLGFSCEEKDEYPEFDDIETIEEATFQSLRINVETLETDTLIDGKVVMIDEDSTYFRLKTANEGCELCFFPDVNFNENTLVGVYYRIECTANGQTKVTKTTDGYHFNVKSVDISECTFLACNNYVLGWHTLPKVDSSTVITSTFGKKYNQCDCQ